MVHREISCGAETLTLPEGAAEGQYLVTIELLPHERPVDTPVEGTAVAKKGEALLGNESGTGGNSQELPASTIGQSAGDGSEGEGVRERDTEESKTEEASLQEHKDNDALPLPPSPSMNPSIAPDPPSIAEKKSFPSLETNHCNDYSSSGSSRDPPPQQFGIMQGQGSVWVEWLVNASRGGSVSVGAMTIAAAEDPDARYCVCCAIHALV